jgi:hypothetical protein
MKFKDYLNENDLYLYHGTNYKGNPFKKMRIGEGNMQEGPGIYFSTYNVAKDYGKYVYKTKKPITLRGFIESRKLVKTQKNLYNKLPNFIEEFAKIDKEEMFYEISNYIEIYEPDDIQPYHFTELAKKYGSEQVRNLLITYVQIFGEQNFLKIFDKIYPNIKGLYNKELNFFALLKPVDLELV